MSDEDLLGTSEVAALLGVSRQRVLVLAKHEGFPQPVAILKMGNVWRSSDVQRWAQTRRAAPPP